MRRGTAFTHQPSLLIHHHIWNYTVSATFVFFPTCRKNQFKSSIRVHPLQYCISAALVNVNHMLINGSGVLVLQRSHRRQAVHLSVEEVHSITTWQQKGCFDNWPLKTLSNNLLTPINPSGTKYLQLINLETLLLIPVYMKRELWCRRYTCLFIPRLSESTPGRQLKGVATVLLWNPFIFSCYVQIRSIPRLSEPRYVQGSCTHPPQTKGPTLSRENNAKQFAAASTPTEVLSDWRGPKWYDDLNQLRVVTSVAFGRFPGTRLPDTGVTFNFIK